MSSGSGGEFQLKNIGREEMEEIIESIGRTPRQRTTTYGEVSELQKQKSFGAKALVEPSYTSAQKYERKGEKKVLVRPGLLPEEDKITGADIV